MENDVLPFSHRTLILKIRNLYSGQMSILNGKRTLITGGAGFIGSHLVDILMKNNCNVRVLDNLSSGRIENIERWKGKENFKFIYGDVLNAEIVEKTVKDCEVIFHLAANPEVRLSSTNPEIHFNQNVMATYTLLEAIRKTGSVEILVFTSSSTVYGDAEEMPTPEEASTKPISVYGACKLACEALIHSYAKTYGFKAAILRLANIIGSRSRHGVIHDFIMKLKRNPRKLEILGDGTQSKSYLHVEDCINAILLCTEKISGVEVYNVGSEDRINVMSIAKIVVEEMGLKNVEFEISGGVDGGRGWIGDVKYMHLDISKLKALGWRPKLNSEEAVRRAARELIREIL